MNQWEVRVKESEQTLLVILVQRRLDCSNNYILFYHLWLYICYLCCCCCCLWNNKGQCIEDAPLLTACMVKHWFIFDPLASFSSASSALQKQACSSSMCSLWVWSVCMCSLLQVCVCWNSAKSVLGQEVPTADFLGGWLPLLNSQKMSVWKWGSEDKAFCFTATLS